MFNRLLIIPYNSNAVSLSIIFLLIGLVFMVFAEEQLDLIFYTVFLFGSGFLLTCLFIGGGKLSYESTTYLLSFGISVFIAGIFCYLFGNDNYADVHHFYNLSRSGWVDQNINEVGSNGALSVFVWRVFYSLSNGLGFPGGMWIGSMFNASLLGVTGALTVKTARIVWGNDFRRLTLVSFFFCFCPMLWMFGGTHIRDVFALFLNLVLVHVWIRMLTRASLINVVLVVLATVFLPTAMYYVRFESAKLPAVTAVCGTLLFLSRIPRRDALLIAFCLMGLCAILFQENLVLLTDRVLTIINYLRSAYMGGGSDASMGTLLVVNQPLPIRLLGGSLYLHLFPIPFWAGMFQTDSLFTILRGLNGLFIILVLPLAVLGLFQVVTNLFRSIIDRRQIFLLTFYGLMTAAVVMSSLEIRHLAQFFPVLFLISAFSDYQEPKTKQRLKHIYVAWLLGVLIIYGVWMIVKFA
jgi:hypothetical protein